MAKQTYTKEERKAQFLKTGVKLAKKNGITKVSAAAVATEHKVTAPLVFHIFGSREKLQAAIKCEAKKQGVVLAEPKPTPAPKRKRSIAEVKAIKDKAAAKPTKKPKLSAPATKKPKVSAPAKVAKKAAAPKKPKVTAPKVKYPTQPVPTAPVDLSANANPTNTL